MRVDDSLELQRVTPGLASKASSYPPQGLWLAPLGYLAYRSGLFPKALGVVLVLATVSYLTDSLTAFLLPSLELQSSHC